MKDAAASIDRLIGWYRSDVLPFWAARAADRSGLFFESLDFDGEPMISGRRRVRVLSRQVYTFTRAAERGWLSAGEAIAREGFHQLIQSACPDEAARGCAHMIDDHGRIIDDKRDLYDQAFLILACASRMGGPDRNRAATIADRTLAFLDRELLSDEGGYAEDDNGSTPRRQNPHMHLFEALMALYSASHDPSHLKRARDIEYLFNAHFLDRNRGIVREYLRNDWSTDARRPDIEPGHMAEWVFLLDRFERLSGEDRSREKQLLYRSAVAMAAPGDAPFLPNRTTIATAGERGARRLWPQLELLMAALVLARGGDSEARRDVQQMIDALFDSYFDVMPSGLWCDEFDATGRAAAKDVPASILYHLHEAVACADDCRERIAA